MARQKFSELVAKTMTSDAIERARRKTARFLEDMPLQELRRAMELSQETIASLLEATQPQVSKIEHSTDLYLSTLRRYVEALGGQLDVVARFPDGSVRISQFSAIGPAEDSVQLPASGRSMEDLMTTLDTAVTRVEWAPPSESCEPIRMRVAEAKVAMSARKRELVAV